jgi:hypothetical protein
MPRTTIHVHEREKMQPVIQKGTPLGALPTEAIVSVGPLNIIGSAKAMRALSEACDEAAAMAFAYDDDPATYDQRERGEAIER